MLLSPGRVLRCGAQRIIGSGVSSQPLTGIPRCLPRTPSSSPTKERRRSAGLATPKSKEPALPSTLGASVYFNQSVQTRIAQLSADNKTWTIFTCLFDVRLGGRDSACKIGVLYSLGVHIRAWDLAHSGSVWTPEAPPCHKSSSCGGSLGRWKVANEVWPSDEVTIE